MCSSRPTGVVARPRGLRVKESAASFLPHLAEALSARRLLPERARLASIYNLDPRRAGARILADRAGASGCGGADPPQSRGFSSLRQVSSLTLVREVMAECGLPQPGAPQRSAPSPR